ncbi:hypothetical protein P3875_04200 [Myroides sp. JBRI-B21084]|uniref:hypothetical protein n=1 Tax=Myroides sp. JBRI-B21084 TaxID=3119977 RepID=UPI0026E418C5|nr:hypothetical protein [Paenimyroides cloacae]WKW47274.1 hypothetical protein P3875_04200 [Paenimyroides cloacae]
MPIKNEEPDIVVDYVFFGKFKTQPNPIIDMCFIMRTKGKTEKVYNKNKNNLNLPYTFQEFKQIAAQLNKNYKEQKKLHQHTKS